MSADDFQPYPSDPSQPLEASSPYTPGNRPASGARRATPGEVLSRGFSGAQNAGDFLGLDVEFTASLEQEVPPVAADLQLEAAPATYESGASTEEAGAPGVPEAPSPMEAPEFAQQPSAFEFGQDLGGEESEPAPARKGRAVPVFATMALVGILGAAGFLYGPELYSRFAGKGTEHVASGPGDSAPQASARATKAGETTAEPEAMASSSSGATDTVSSEPATESPLASDQAFDPASAEPGSSPPLASAMPFDPTATDAAGPMDGTRVPEESEESADDLVASLLGAPPIAPDPTSSTTPFPDLSGAEFEWASEDQLELIWRGTTVPMEAVFASARTLMPRVGNVRIFTGSGDVFEGRLYAVGQERVWLDAAPGQRIGLDGNQVTRIEALAAEPAPQGLAGTPVSGKRVRVRVPGGVLYGRVLKTDGETVTLALDEGGRVSVKSASLEELGSGRAVVVHR